MAIVRTLRQECIYQDIWTVQRGKKSGRWRPLLELDLTVQYYSLVLNSCKKKTRSARQERQGKARALRPLRVRLKKAKNSVYSAG